MGARQTSKVRLVPEGFSSAASKPAQKGTTMTLSHFTGTDNPREKRLLANLLCRSLSREEADKVTGASNSPDWVMKLRRKGLEIPCKRTASKDRDGRSCRPGTYSLTSRDRRQIKEWIKRGGGFRVFVTAR